MISLLSDFLVVEGVELLALAADGPVVAPFQRPLMYDHTIQVVLESALDQKCLWVPDDLVVLDFLTVLLLESLELDG